MKNLAKKVLGNFLLYLLVLVVNINETISFISKQILIFISKQFLGFTLLVKEVLGLLSIERFLGFLLPLNGILTVLIDRFLGLISKQVLKLVSEFLYFVGLAKGYIGNLKLKNNYILKIFGIVIVFYYPQNSVWLLSMYNLRNTIKISLDYYISNLIILFISYKNIIIEKLKIRIVLNKIIELDLIGLLLGIIITLVVMNLVENILNNIIILNNLFVEIINKLYSNSFDNSLSIIQLDMEYLNDKDELFKIILSSNFIVGNNFSNKIIKIYREIKIFLIKFKNWITKK